MWESSVPEPAQPGQITAVDDAVKETNTEVLSIMLPRDTKGWGGHGNYIVIGAETVGRCQKSGGDCTGKDEA